MAALEAERFLQPSDGLGSFDWGDEQDHHHQVAGGTLASSVVVSPGVAHRAVAVSAPVSVSSSEKAGAK
jgi:hypothetical protein